MNKNKSKKYIDIEKEEILNNRIFINEYNQHRLIIISIINQVGHKFKLLFDLTTDTIKNKTSIIKLQQSQNKLDLVILNSSKILIKELLDTPTDRLYYDPILIKPFSINIIND